MLPRSVSQVRSRSVERLRVADCDREGVVTQDPPIRVYRGESLRCWMPVFLYLGGLACFVLAVCIGLAWFSPPRLQGDSLALTLFLFEGSFILMGAAFLVGRRKRDLLCEIGEKGILAPGGVWGRRTFVPWGDLTRCEIVHEDEKVWCDHFVLWDRAGNRRFRSCERWLYWLSRSDRARILRALRSRFPRKDELDPNAEPVLAGQASSAVWDRELDG